MSERFSDRLRPDPAATFWGSGGRAYDEISYALSDAIGHAAKRLDAQSGDSVLDVATGTGWAARLCSRHGASVTAIDFSEELIAAARELSGHARPPIRFQRADAQALPFANGCFDKVISTFGVMFAADQEKAAAELKRVTCPGGRLVLASWVPGGSVQKFFEVVLAFDDGPPGEASPLRWGERSAVEDLLGDAFDLVFEDGTNIGYHPSVEAIWQSYVRGFGPIRSIHEALDDARGAEFKAAVDAYHEGYMTPAGLRVPRDYLLVIARRR